MAQRLNLSRVKLEAWLKGYAIVPDDVFFAIVDLLLAHGLQEIAREEITRAVPARLGD